MGEFSLWHLIVILVVVLIFFGPSRLPGLGNSIGKAIRGFKEGMKGIHDPASDEKPAQSAQETLPPGKKSDADHSASVEKDKNKV